MTFQPTIPKSTDLISVSQGDILNNFTAIGTSFDVNHIDFNAAGAGKHKFVEMPNQAGDPAGAATEGTIYTKVATQTELFFRRDAGTVVQMTNGTPNIVGPNGTTFLPGGVILKWGQFNMAGGVTSQAVVFIGTFVGGVHSIVLTQTSSNSGNEAGINVGTITTGGFTAFRGATPASNLTYFYFAIGN